MSEIDLSTIAVPKTAIGLRDAMFDEINALRAGSTNLNKAKLISQLAARIIEATRLEVTVSKKLTNKEPLQLGTLNET